MFFGPLAASVLVALSLAAGGTPAGTNFDPWVQTARYELALRVKLSPLVEGDVKTRLWIPLPRDSDNQQLLRYDVTAPVRFSELTDDCGNRMIYLEPIAGQAADSQVLVKMFVERRVTRRSSPDAPAGSVNEPSRYLGATSKVPLGGVVGALAKRVGAGMATPPPYPRVLRLCCFQYAIQQRG